MGPMEACMRASLRQQGQTDCGVVYAWGSNDQGQLGVNNTTQQAQALGVLMRRSTAPLRWSEHLCNGSPARMVACGDYHTLVPTQAGEVFACGRGRHGETGNSLLPDIVRVPEHVPGLYAMALVDAGDMFSGAVGVDGQVWMWGKCGRGPPCDAADVQSGKAKESGVGCVWRLAGRAPEPARKPRRSGDGAGRTLGLGPKHLR